MSDSVQPHRQQPTRLLCLWDSPGKNTGVGCHCLLQCMKVKSKSEVAQSCQLLASPWTAAYQAPLSMGLSRQEYWSGVPLGYSASNAGIQLPRLEDCLQTTIVSKRPDPPTWGANIRGTLDSSGELSKPPRPRFPPASPEMANDMAWDPGLV